MQKIGLSYRRAVFCRVCDVLTSVELLHQGRVCVVSHSDYDASVPGVFTSTVDGPVVSMHLKHVAGTGVSCDTRMDCFSNWCVHQGFF